ncbi:U4/U6-U5 snRNP complex subunit PRP3 [Nakaseomyces bracarensis]|uniref:U4/U6-U5 snRNP complex subunit PRP3 n=1 Tax=Nakaseomyces bracarensis TaxID=273131 RepID=UPI0038710446
MPPAKKKKVSEGKGLNVELHPALNSSNANVIKAQQKEINPYLATQEISLPVDKVHRRYRRGLKFFNKGEISAKAEEERAQLIAEKERADKERDEREEERRREEELIQERIKKGELPDSSLGEDNYFLRYESTLYEWWDEEYLNDKGEILPKYKAEYPVTPDSEYDSDDHNGSEKWMKNEDEDESPPSLRYVQHPVLVRIEEAPTTSRVYLTKDEQKKIRRKNRRHAREEQQARIKLGLEPKPETKVKLKNMMNVLDNNQNITDPTSWEKTVREQVEERRKKHLEMNKQRHLNAVEAKKKKAVVTPSSSPGTGVHCKAFFFGSLVHPKIRYKLNMNSKQLGLKGVCLRVHDDGPGIIVVVGTEKSTKFYQKLVLSRIKWKEDFMLKNKEEETRIDMSKNFAKEIWSGFLTETNVDKWFMKICQSEEEMKSILADLQLENFYSLYLQERHN